MDFEYSAASTAGQVVRGNISASSEVEALSMLQQQGLMQADAGRLQCSPHGLNYLNHVLAQFE